MKKITLLHNISLNTFSGALNDEQGCYSGYFYVCAQNIPVEVRERFAILSIL